jgi:sialate O-acetylesterase
MKKKQSRCSRTTFRSIFAILLLLFGFQIYAQEKPIDRFENTIIEYEQQDVQDFPLPDGIVFTGSSSIRMWNTIQADLAPLPIISRGFGGSTIPEVLHYADRVIYPYQPQMIVIYAGENDIAGGVAPAQVLQNFIALANDIEENLPQTEVYFISIKPSVLRVEKWPAMRQANNLIREYIHKNENLHYLDGASTMLQENGQVKEDIFLKDNLHMNAKGYAGWTGLMKPELQAAWPGYQLWLPEFFSDQMVLQRGEGTAVWGRANPGEIVTVSIDNKTRQSTVQADGHWLLHLPYLVSGGPHQLKVTAGKETKIFNEVMIGDVWLASGQSNMEWSMKSVDNSRQEIAEANYPNIRLFTVKRDVSHVPLRDVSAANWQPCTPETVANFSAVAYFFARHIHQKENIPIGVIHSSWGGTSAEAWTSLPMLHTLPDYKLRVEDIWQKPENYKANEPENEKLRALRDSLYWQVNLGEKQKAHTSKYKDENWKIMEQPNDWGETELKSYDGFVWFRKEVTLPADWKGEDLIMSLGIIRHDALVYFNGSLVEEHENGGRVKAYRIPGKQVKKGVNQLAVRILNHWGAGGLTGKPENLNLALADKNETISLAGEWKYNANIEPEIPNVPGYQNQPAALYNAMIAPLEPFGLKGFIWYQGENNASRAYQYQRLFPTMITDWRVRFKQGNLPFLFVQLANFMETQEQPVDDNWAELREAQLMTLDYPNTGMAVTIDIGEADDIHPRNKQDVGKRLALAAEKLAYDKNLVYSGPIFESMEKEDGKILLHFEHAGSGLVTNDGMAPIGFAIAGDDQKFVWAQAEIVDKNTIAVWSSEVEEPVAVRYAWQSNPPTNLYNQEGIPASPFRTDNWKGVTE